MMGFRLISALLSPDRKSNRICKWCPTLFVLGAKSYTEGTDQLCGGITSYIKGRTTTALEVPHNYLNLEMD